MAKEIDFAKAFETGMQQNQDLSAGSFSDLLNDLSSKTGEKMTFSFDTDSKKAFKDKYGEQALQQAESTMANALMTNTEVNSIAGFFSPRSNVKQLQDSEYQLFFPQAKMSSEYQDKAPSIEFEWNGTKTPIAKLTTEQVADVNSIYFDSEAGDFKALNEDVLKTWSSDNWSLDNFSATGDLQQLFGFEKERDERVTLMRNEDMAKLDTQEAKKVAQAISLGKINGKDIYRAMDKDTQQFKPVWRTVLENEDPFTLNNIRSVWGPKTIQHNNYFSELTESFNDAFMSALDGAYFTSYTARKLTSAFTSPQLTDAQFNTQLETEFNKYQQWSQGRRSTAAEEDSEAWYDNMTNLSKGVVNGVGQLIATGGVGTAGKLGVGALTKLATTKGGLVLGGKVVAETLSTVPANIARGFSAAYAMSSAQQEARRAGLNENESLIMAGLAGATLQLTEKMIGGNDSWFYKAFVPKEVSSKAGKFITQRVIEEAKLSGKTIAKTLQDPSARSSIMNKAVKMFTEETDVWWKSGMQAFAQESVQEVSEDGINKINQFGFNSVADGLKFSGYDWVNDKARYHQNLNETMEELFGSFVIGGLTGGLTSSAMSLGSSKQEAQKEIDGSRMNSLVHFYVDNKGDVGEYFTELDEIRKNEWIGNPYVTSEVDKKTKSRKLMDKISSIATKTDKPTKMNHTDYMYDLMKAEADWVFGSAKKIEEQQKALGVDPYTNAAAFGEEVTKMLDMSPANTPDILAVDKSGKINTLTQESYNAAIEGMSTEDTAKSNIEFLSADKATQVKKDLLVKDIQSSIFLEGMHVGNKKNEILNKLTLQLAKRNSMSLFREVDHTSVRAYDGNYKGSLEEGEIGYDSAYDSEFSANYNKLKDINLINTKNKIKEQNKLVSEKRQLQSQINAIENKATRYGYDSVSTEVTTALEKEIKAKDVDIEAIETEINTTINTDFGFEEGADLNEFKADLRSLVEYEQYTNNTNKRLDYYKNKAKFNITYNESTFSEDLKNLLDKGWSPYDYEDDNNELVQSEAALARLDALYKTKQAVQINQLKVEDDFESDMLAVDDFLTAVNSTDMTYVPKAARGTVKNNLDKIDPREIIFNKTGIDVSEKGDPSSNPRKTKEQTEKFRTKSVDNKINILDKYNESSFSTEKLTVDLAYLKAALGDNAEWETLTPEQKKESEYNDDDLFDDVIPAFQKLVNLVENKIADSSYRLPDDYLSALEQAYLDNFRLADTLVESNALLLLNNFNIVDELDLNQSKLIQDNGESLILDESLTAILDYQSSTEMGDPKSYRTLAEGINKILPRLYYSEIQRMYKEGFTDEDSANLAIYNYIVNSKGQDMVALRQGYKELIDTRGDIDSTLVKAVLFREELEGIALDLEQAISNRFIQDIDFQHSYLVENKATLLDFIKKADNPKLDAINTLVTNLELPTKVSPVGKNDVAVNEYVQKTIDKAAELLQLEQELSNILTNKDYEKIVTKLTDKYATEDKAVLFRRFDDKGLKYKKEDLQDSAKLERELNYLMLLNRGTENFYDNIKEFLNDASKVKDTDFIINFSQFLALRQLYSFGVSDTSNKLKRQISEIVRKNIIDYQGSENLIIDPKYITEEDSLPLAGNIFNARGLPGVGKTEYLLKYFIRMLKGKPKAKILVSAPKIEQLKTIQNSIEKLKGEVSQEVVYRTYEELETSKDLDSFTYVIIDESSLLMPSGFLNKMDTIKPKVILSGDELQETGGSKYAMYFGSNNFLSSKTLKHIQYITERGETLDTVVRSGNVDTAKYIDTIAQYIPAYNNLFGRFLDTSDSKKAELEAEVKKISDAVKPETTFYYEKAGVVQKGLKVVTNEDEFIDNIAARHASNPKDFKVIIPTDFVISSKVFLKKLEKAGIPVGTLSEKVDKDKNLVITSVASQGKTIPDVFVYIPDTFKKEGVHKLYTQLSAIFVGTSRSSNSLVVLQPEELSNLVPFESAPVSNPDKVLTFPPFSLPNGDLSPDTKKRQDNFKAFINKLSSNPKAGSASTGGSPSSSSTSSTTSKTGSAETSEFDDEVTPPTDEEVTEAFFDVFDIKNVNNSYNELITSFDKALEEVVDDLELTSSIEVDEILELEDLIKKQLNTFDVMDSTNSAGMTTAEIELINQNAILLRDQTQNDTIRELMQNKIDQIQEYNESLVKLTEEETKEINEIMKKSKKGSSMKSKWKDRDIFIKTIKEDYENYFDTFSGFGITIDTEKVTVYQADTYESEIKLDTKEEKATRIDLLLNLGYYVVSNSVDYKKDDSDFKIFLKTIFNQEENKAIFKDIDINNLSEIRNAILLKSSEENISQARARNEKLDADKTINMDSSYDRALITQLILLSDSPQGQRLGIKPIKIPVEIMSEQDHNKIKTLPIMKPTESVITKTEPSETRPEPTSNAPADQGELITQLENLIATIEITPEILAEENTPVDNFIDLSCLFN